MATIKIANSFDMFNADLSGLFDYLNSSFTATEARYFNDATNYLSFQGLDLTYDPANVMDGGTITKIVSSEDGTKTVVFSNLSPDGGEVFSAFRAEDVTGLWDILLSGNDIFQGSAEDDNLRGNAGNDRIYGNGGTDFLFGEAGSDKLFGGDQFDKLVGGFGNDTLDGGKDNDLLFGGRGKDNFVFNQAPGAADSDFIMDFRVEDDTINLDRSVFAGVGVLGVLGAGKFYVGAAAHDASDRIIYDDVTGTLYYDADGNGAGAALQFAAISRGLELTNADFANI